MKHTMSGVAAAIAALSVAGAQAQEQPAQQVQQALGAITVEGNRDAEGLHLEGSSGTASQLSPIIRCHRNSERPTKVRLRVRVS